MTTGTAMRLDHNQYDGTYAVLAPDGLLNRSNWKEDGENWAVKLNLFSKVLKRFLHLNTSENDALCYRLTGLKHLKRF
jgi:hypothetical protein